MKFWISLTLGLMTYFLFVRSAAHEAISIIATLLVMAVAYGLIGWWIEGQLPFTKKTPPGE